ncbi:hypothetical protein CPB86DRAFT_348332 [Serendipita vermifera]|nr:hypothetical protein CPB86DRAFT_348332 [Serendipita vermifera]
MSLSVVPTFATPMYITRTLVTVLLLTYKLITTKRLLLMCQISTLRICSPKISSTFSRLASYWLQKSSVGKST